MDLSLFYLLETYTTVDVLNTVTGKWSRLDMDKNLATYAYATSGNKIVLGGGRLKIHDPGYIWATSTKFVQILDVSLLTSQSENSNDLEIKMYPNPSHGEFNISLLDHEGELFVTDIFGNEIMKTNVRENNLKIELGQTGNYLVYFKSKQGIAVKKLCVVK